MDYTKLLVKSILNYPLGHDWQIQGLGMLRFYLSPEVRLHVWDRAALFPGVSSVHTHPWDFESLIVVGHMRNVRFTEGSLSGDTWNRVIIKCGSDACLKSLPEPVSLQEHPMESYKEGDVYHQYSTEIHCSLPEDGTVTLITRTFKRDKDHAFVYWRGPGSWVDAKPRSATEEEILTITKRALDTWF